MTVRNYPCRNQQLTLHQDKITRPQTKLFSFLFFHFWSLKGIINLPCGSVKLIRFIQIQPTGFVLWKINYVASLSPSFLQISLASKFCFNIDYHFKKYYECCCLKSKFNRILNCVLLRIIFEVIRCQIVYHVSVTQTVSLYYKRKFIFQGSFFFF